MRYLTLPVIGVFCALVSVSRADDIDGAHIYTQQEDEELIKWVLVASKEAAHKTEPKNPVPKPMTRKLAELLVKYNHDIHKLSLLIEYAFAEGAYSEDYTLPGDCLGVPPGSPKCTTRMIEEGIICCDVKHARHFCVLQVEPKPNSLEECIKRGSDIMQKDIDTCPDHPGSVYATGGICGYSYRIDWRARIAKKLEDLSQ